MNKLKKALGRYNWKPCIIITMMTVFSFTACNAKADPNYFGTWDDDQYPTNITIDANKIVEAFDTGKVRFAVENLKWVPKKKENVTQSEWFPTGYVITGTLTENYNSNFGGDVGASVTFSLWINSGKDTLALIIGPTYENRQPTSMLTKRK